MAGAVEIFIMLDCQGKKLHTKEMTPVLLLSMERVKVHIFGAVTLLLD